MFRPVAPSAASTSVSTIPSQPSEAPSTATISFGSPATLLPQ
jgi:hypothetical protein